MTVCAYLYVHTVYTRTHMYIVYTLQDAQGAAGLLPLLSTTNEVM